MYFFFLGTVWFLWSLVNLYLAYLSQKSSRTLHSSEECTGQWMRHVFNSPDGKSTYRFLSFPTLSPITGWVCDKAYYHLLFLIWPAQLAYSLVGFLIRRFYYTFLNKFRNIHLLKHVNKILKRNRFTIKTTRSKCKTLCGALDWFEWVFGFLPWGYFFW